MSDCPFCGGDMLGDGITEVRHCENAETETYQYHEPDGDSVYCDKGGKP